jgi:hypothetical protein
MKNFGGCGKEIAEIREKRKMRKLVFCFWE